MKKILLTLLFLSTFPLFGITGYWKAIDEKTGRARCVVAVYENGGRYYGRIVGSYDPQGAMRDTIYTPIERAPGVKGNPYYSGIDIIWGLEPRGTKYYGKIIDPEKGNVYNCELWTQNGALIVRGKLLCFGRNQTWLPASQNDFPQGFQIPDTRTFTPAFPNCK